MTARAVNDPLVEQRVAEHKMKGAQAGRLVRAYLIGLSPVELLVEPATEVAPEILGAIEEAV
jgi:hypothetical protein